MISSTGQTSTTIKVLATLGTLLSELYFIEAVLFDP